jgi:hypothetical protein
MMARWAKFKITKDGQERGKTFRFDLKRWKHLKNTIKNQLKNYKNLVL